MDPQMVSEWSTAFILTVWQQLFQEISRRLEIMQEMKEEAAAARNYDQGSKRQRREEPQEPQEEPVSCNHRCDYCNRLCGRYSTGHSEHSCWHHRNRHENFDGKRL